eukprot:CAMPEP_0184017690 /NCGR_PEP_ID=MMETSP0954-20121128/7692_1 /TAXON_ID=627963 /ORGANISM="Aplanochytrium sp, Strain PBS07" /LENGTH=433 /DNA_ID=CAMNT_0026298985 /DNA_START=274 /DNA_END=1575 /DNA_ORIENTATION=-
MISKYVRLISSSGLDSPQIAELLSDAERIQSHVAIEEEKKQKLLQAVKEGDIDTVDSICSVVMGLSKKWDDMTLPERLEIQKAKRIVRENCDILVLQNAIDSGSLSHLYDVIPRLKRGKNKYLRFAELKTAELEDRAINNCERLSDYRHICGIVSLKELDDCEKELEELLHILSKSPNGSTVRFVKHVRQGVQKEFYNHRVEVCSKFLLLSIVGRDVRGIEKYSKLIVKLGKKSDTITQLLLRANDTRKQCDNETAVKSRLLSAMKRQDFAEAMKICRYVEILSKTTDDDEIKIRIGTIEAEAEIAKQTDYSPDELPLHNWQPNTGLALAVTQGKIGLEASSTRSNETTDTIKPSETSLTMSRSLPPNPAAFRKLKRAENLIAALELKADLNSRLRQVKHRVIQGRGPAQQDDTIYVSSSKKSRTELGICNTM